MKICLIVHISASINTEIFCHAHPKCFKISFLSCNYCLMWWSFLCLLMKQFTEANLVPVKTSSCSTSPGSEIKVQPNKPSSTEKLMKDLIQVFKNSSTSPQEWTVGVVSTFLFVRKWPQIPQISQMHTSLVSLDESLKISARDCKGGESELKRYSAFWKGI